MMDLLIRNVRIPRDRRLERVFWVAISQGKIACVEASGAHPPSARDVVDGASAILAPGFIDLHIHGTGPYFIEDSPEDFRGLCRLLPEYGVTAFLPTIIPHPDERAHRVAEMLAGTQCDGAEVLGLFVEGPFLTMAGAACPIAPTADADWLQGMIKAAAPLRPIFAIAPDFPCIDTLLPELLRASDGVLFMAHTQATGAETERAIALGARHATHFYNVMYPPREEGEPGVRTCGFLEAIMAHPEVTVDFILDGDHVDPLAARMAIACKGIGGVCLITDANRGAGNEPGVYRAFGHEIEFTRKGGPARFTASHPTLPHALAGSGLTMDAAVRNAVSMLQVGIADAITMASENPARVLGMEDMKGRIAEGFDADLVLLDETTLTPLATWNRGKQVYRKERALK